jgi:SAM-dependent methyltransferase
MEGSARAEAGSRLPPLSDNLERVHEILRNLPPGARVLDLGCAGGSFPSGDFTFTVVRIDLERPDTHDSKFVQADAAMLPFPAGCFDALISNHSLEHFDNLTASLDEIARVAKPNGSLYVAVPDATTISDRLYRWLARGGGHVNAFSSAHDLALRIERATGLKHIATRALCASLSCFNRKNRRTRAPRRLIVIGGGTQISLRLLTYIFRLIDRFLRTRLSVYGWAFYFGNIKIPIDTRTATNVCIRCGSGHPSDWLLQNRNVRHRFLFPTYRCPTCDTKNLFTNDKHYTHLSPSRLPTPDS